MEEYTEESKAQCGLKAGGAMKVLMVFFSVLVNLSCMELAYSQSNMDERRNSAVGDYIRIYQNRISEQKNSRCAMYPSCSNYGLQVFADKPFWEALPLLADRLCRCSHDARFYDVTYKPVSFNKIGYTSESKVENLVSTLCLARFALSLQKF